MLAESGNCKMEEQCGQNSDALSEAIFQVVAIWDIFVVFISLLISGVANLIQ
jgi:hypothetical protein